MLSQRLLFGSLMIAALVGIFWLDTYISQSAISGVTSIPISGPGNLPAGIVITFVWLIVVFFATREMGQLFVAGGQQPATGRTALANCALGAVPLAARWNESSACAAYLLGVVLVGTAVIALSVAGRRHVVGATANISLSLLMLIYLGLLGSFIPRLAIDAGNAWVLLYVLLVIKSCDIGAYLIGRKIGRTKLIEWLSPKKTREGLAGGIATSIGVAMLGAWVFGLGVHKSGTAEIHWPRTAAFGLFVGVLGQAGDLFESLIKRDLKVKDSAALVPAFGGLLDILDSPLVCVPVAYWMLLY